MSPYWYTKVVLLLWILVFLGSWSSLWILVFLGSWSSLWKSCCGSPAVEVLLWSSLDPGLLCGSWSSLDPAVDVLLPV